MVLALRKQLDDDLYKKFFRFMCFQAADADAMAREVEKVKSFLMQMVKQVKCFRSGRGVDR